MKDLLIDLFGSYTPYEYTITEIIYDSNGNATGSVVSSAVIPDWVWICGVAGFFLILFCLLRFLYNVIKG